MTYSELTYGTVIDTGGNGGDGSRSGRDDRMHAAQPVEEARHDGPVGGAALAAVDRHHREGDAAAEADQPGIGGQRMPGAVFRGAGLGEGARRQSAVRGRTGRDD